MKTGKLIAKIVVALAAVAGVVYVIATYGEQIVAWCKKMLESCKCKCCCEAEPEAVVEEAEAEAVVEEAEAEPEAVAEEVVEAEIPAEEEVADEADFEA